MGAKKSKILCNRQPLTDENDSLFIDSSTFSLGKMNNSDVITSFSAASLTSQSRTNPLFNIIEIVQIIVDFSFHLADSKYILKPPYDKNHLQRGRDPNEDNTGIRSFTLTLNIDGRCTFARFKAIFRLSLVNKTFRYAAFNNSFFWKNMILNDAPESFEPIFQRVFTTDLYMKSFIVNLNLRDSRFVSKILSELKVFSKSFFLILT
jgi:hypothetical protein